MPPITLSKNDLPVYSSSLWSRSLPHLGVPRLCFKNQVISSYFQAAFRKLTSWIYAIYFVKFYRFSDLNDTGDLLFIQPCISHQSPFGPTWILSPDDSRRTYMSAQFPLLLQVYAYPCGQSIPLVSLVWRNFIHLCIKRDKILCKKYSL